MAEVRRKVVVVGDSWCGKTALIKFFTRGYVLLGYVPTLFENYVADVEVDGKHVKLAIWDTSGVEEYIDHLRPLSYPDSHVIIICFDIANSNSLENVKYKWISEVRHFCPTLPIILVGCKKELRHDPRTIDHLNKELQRDPHTIHHLMSINQPPVTYDEGLEMSKEICAQHYVECSGRTGEGVRKVFEYATRCALIPRPGEGVHEISEYATHHKKSSRPTSRIQFIKQIFKPASKSKSSKSLEDAPDETIDAARKLEEIVTNADNPKSLKTIRLLIIGKSGCGKTTILSKVCGRNMLDAPSTMKGIHDIEKEIKFEGNSQMVAHDSEGFEVGCINEVNVVKDFIESRSKMDDINKRLHLVWYCVEMSSRPIQQAEKDFFSNPPNVPVVAIVTKFDTFVQDVLQKIEEAAVDEELDDDTIEKEADGQAKTLYEQHYKQPLQKLPFPPKAVVSLYAVHESTPDDSRLANLIQVTMDALAIEESDLQGQEQTVYDLSTFFAVAQNADTKTKLTISTINGILWNFDRPALPMFRGGPFIRIWETFWSNQHSTEHSKKLLDALQALDHSPRIIGHPKSSDLAEVKDGDPDLLRHCRWEQMVADTALIMEKVFVYDIRDEDKLQGLIKWYDQKSATAIYIRGEIMRLYQERRRSGQVPSAWSHEMAQPLVDIVLNRPLEAPQ